MIPQTPYRCATWQQGWVPQPPIEFGGVKLTDAASSRRPVISNLNYDVFSNEVRCPFSRVSSISPNTSHAMEDTTSSIPPIPRSSAQSGIEGSEASGTANQELRTIPSIPFTDGMPQNCAVFVLSNLAFPDDDLAEPIFPIFVISSGDEKHKYKENTAPRSLA